MTSIPTRARRKLLALTLVTHPLIVGSLFTQEGSLEGFEQFIRTAVMVLVPMILSLTVHEYAHAIVASLIGDDTAKSQGRMTLNPVSHIDPMGTLVLPLFSVFAATQVGPGGFPFFGWAKPVPYNPLRFRRTISMRWGTVLVAAAGPLSNLLFALVCTGALAVWHYYKPTDVLGPGNPGAELLKITMQINVALFFFNLIPIPPLDGSRVLANLLPYRFSPVFATLERYSFILFIVLLVTRAFEFVSYPAGMLIRGLFRLAIGA
jgi:Zn-dependent protease